MAFRRMFLGAVVVADAAAVAADTGSDRRLQLMILTGNFNRRLRRRPPSPDAPAPCRRQHLHSVLFQISQKLVYRCESHASHGIRASVINGYSSCGGV